MVRIEFVIQNPIQHTAVRILARFGFVRILRYVRIMHRLVRVILTVRKQVPVLQALIADQQAEVQLASVPPIVKVEKQVVVREEVQVNETIVVPIIEITALPVPGAVVPAVVAPVAVILVAVDLPGAMFLVDKQKDALLPEVREAIALKALPVPLKETAAVQEDNLFLYYLYQSHYSSVEGELDSGFSPARLFRATPVTWMRLCQHFDTTSFVFVHHSVFLMNSYD